MLQLAGPLQLDDARDRTSVQAGTSDRDQALPRDRDRTLQLDRTSIRAGTRDRVEAGMSDGLQYTRLSAIAAGLTSGFAAPWIPRCCTFPPSSRQPRPAD